MKKIISFRLNMKTPPLDYDTDEVIDDITVLRLWCHDALHMPTEMIKAITIEQVEEVKP